MANPQRRAQIMEAATTLFNERGYVGTSMHDIARDVGMSASSLYNHFSSKHEVLADIMHITMQNLLLEHARVLASAPDSPREQLRASVETHVRFHANNAAATQVSNHEINNLDPEARAMIRQLRRDYVARWVTLLEKGIAHRQFVVDDPRLTTYAIIDMGIGVALWFRPDGAHSAETLGQHYGRMALRMVGCTGAD